MLLFSTQRQMKRSVVACKLYIRPTFVWNILSCSLVLGRRSYYGGGGFWNVSRINRFDRNCDQIRWTFNNSTLNDLPGIFCRKILHRLRDSALDFTNVSTLIAGLHWYMYTLTDLWVFYFIVLLCYWYSLHCTYVGVWYRFPRIAEEKSATSQSFQFLQFSL